MQGLKIDRFLFFSASLIAVSVCIPLGLMPELSGSFVSGLYNWISSNLGIFYQWIAIATIVFLGWLSFGPYGRIRLGGERPDFSTFSWVSMLFCAGIGATLLVWSGVEWAYYYDSPPYGVEPRSTEAIEWATAYGPFHWGVTAWCFYALPTIAIAYPFYVKRVHHLRASTSLHAILAPFGKNSILSRIVDLAVMVALLGGAGTSLAMTAPSIAASFAELVNIETSFKLEFSVMMLCIGLFAVSVYLGIEKGIKRLSTINVYLILAMLAFILIVGPTLFILQMSTDTLGFMLGPLCTIGVFNNDIGRRQSRFHVARLVSRVQHDIVFSCQDLKGARLHRFQRIENPIQHLIVHFNRLQRGIGGLFIFRSDRSDGIPLKSYLIDYQ